MSCRVLGRLISNTSIRRPWPSAPVSINRNTHAIYDAPAGSDPAGHTDLVPTPPISGHSRGTRPPAPARGPQLALQLARIPHELPGRRRLAEAVAVAVGHRQGPRLGGVVLGG